MKEMGVKTVATSSPIIDYDIVPYQMIHNTGGTIMGADPPTSVNNFLQHWDAENLLVVGGWEFFSQWWL